MIVDRKEETLALTEEGLFDFPDVTSHWVRLASGARAHYVTSGASGPPVVLLHGGLPGSAGLALWSHQLAALGRAGFRVYAPDRPGFGLADTRKEHWPSYGIFSWVDFVNNFVDALCLDHFHLAGNSQGTSVAAQYICEHPERVISFAFVASFSLMTQIGLDDDGKARERFPAKYQLIPWDGQEETMRKNLQSVAYDPSLISDDLVTMRTRYANLQEKPFRMANEFNSNIRSSYSHWQRYDLRSRLPKIDIPGIFLWGKDDVMAPVEAGHEAQQLLNNIQFLFPDRCGHCGQIDRHDLFNRVFTEFFTTGKLSPDLSNEAGG